MKTSRNKILIIGYGKLGSHLNHALKKTTGFKVSGIVKSSKSRINKKLISDAGIIFITTQDSKIKNAVNRLLSSEVPLKNKFVFHTSGSLTSDELKPLEKAGAITGSFHPVQTFESAARKDEGRFKGIYCALEGSKTAISKSKNIALKLGSKTIVLSKKSKVYHHICCVIASNFLAALMYNVDEITSKKMKLKKSQINGFKNHTFFNIYKPLAMQTLENIAAKGSIRSITGPIERNDIETVSKHLGSVTKQMLPVYILMGIETVKLSLKKKSIKPVEASGLLKTFDKYLKNNKIR